MSLPFIPPPWVFRLDDVFAVEHEQKLIEKYQDLEELWGRAHDKITGRHETYDVWAAVAIIGRSGSLSTDLYRVVAAQGWHQGYPRCRITVAGHVIVLKAPESVRGWTGHVGVRWSGAVLGDAGSPMLQQSVGDEKFVSVSPISAASLVDSLLIVCSGFRR